MTAKFRRLFLTVALAAAAAFTPVLAQAAPMTATANVNVRETPGGAVVDVLRRGDTVDVRDCRRGWCELRRGGFVSENYLRSGAGSGGPGLGITIGPGGVDVTIGNQRPPQRPPVQRPRPPRPPVFDRAEVCFYARENFRGDSFCMEEGDSTRRLQRRWNDEISSIRNPEGLSVTVCRDADFRQCRTYTTSARSLGRLDDEISSIRVR